jgi:hypothetical protein
LSWHTEHSDGDDDTGTATVIWQLADGEHWPGFDCKHAHCVKRKLKEVLEWAEGKTPGIVDRHCTRERIWDRSSLTHIGKKERSQILHGEGHLESDVYTEVAEIIAPKHLWYNRGNRVVRIELVPSGFSYSSNPNRRYKIEAHSMGLVELSGLYAKTEL